MVDGSKEIQREIYDYQVLPVIIYKTPLEFAYSKSKRGELGGVIDGWVRTHRRLFDILDSFTTVKYERLARNPKCKLQSLCQELGIDYFPGKENFWESDTEHFLFGSSTVRNSDHLIYYEAQYDEEKMAHLEETLDLEREDLEDVLAVLEAYEVDAKSEVPESIKQLKEDIAEFRLYDWLWHKASSTPYYRINRTLPKLVYWSRRALLKAKKVSKSLLL